MIDNQNNKIKHCINSIRYNMTGSTEENNKILQELVYHYFDSPETPIETVKINKITHRLFITNKSNKTILTILLPDDLINRLTNSYIDKEPIDYVH